MGNRQVKYSVDHDLRKYEARIKAYIDMGYTLSEVKEEGKNKSCVMVKEKQPRIMFSYEEEVK